MSNVVESKNNLIKHKLGILRDKNTGTKEFREIIQEIGAYLCYEALNDIELEQIEIETPVSKTKVGRLREDNLVFIPILRAGLGMTDGVLRVIPNAKFGHIGMYRDEKTFEIKSVAIPLT